MEKPLYFKGKTIWISNDLKHQPLRKDHIEDLNIGARVLYEGEHHKLQYNRTTGILKITKNIAESEQDLTDLEEAVKNYPENNTTLRVLPGGFQIPLGNITEIKYLD